MIKIGKITTHDFDKLKENFNELKIKNGEESKTVE